jgi:hypothetical protein
LESKPTLDNYALKMGENSPLLAPMQPKQTANNPILLVYAMQHSSGLSKFNPNEILPWVEPFQNFLCVGTHGQPALLVSVLPRYAAMAISTDKLCCEKSTPNLA